MSFVSEYVSGIIVVSVLTVLLENILPNTQDKKYIQTVIGLLVMLVIVAPLSRLTELRGSFVLPDTVINDFDLTVPNGNQSVAEEFEKRLSERLEETVMEACDKEVSVSVNVSQNEANAILGIESITVFPAEEEICRILAETTGIAREQIFEGRGNDAN